MKYVRNVPAGGGPVHGEEKSRLEELEGLLAPDLPANTGQKDS